MNLEYRNTWIKKILWNVNPSSKISSTKGNKCALEWEFQATVSSTSFSQKKRKKCIFVDGGFLKLVLNNGLLLLYILKFRQAVWIFSIGNMWNFALWNAKFVQTMSVGRSVFSRLRHLKPIFEFDSEGWYFLEHIPLVN